MPLNDESVSLHDPTRRTSKEIALWVLFGAVAGVALRLFELDAQSYWADEAISWDRATMPLPQMMSALTLDYAAAPLHYLVLREWLAIVGNTSAMGRLLSALFGIATLPAIYWLGRELYDRTTGAVGVVLLATSELAIAYSQEVRAYSQLMLLTTATIALYVRAVERRSLASFVGAAVCAVLSLATHHYAGLMIVALGLWHLFYARDRIPLPWFALALAIAAAGYLPWLLSGVVDSALNASIAKAQPSYFSANWDTPFENVVAFGNGRLGSVIERASTPWAVVTSIALFCAPVLLLMRRRWERGYLAPAVVVAYGAITASWKWVLLAASLMILGRWIESVALPRRWAAVAFAAPMLCTAAIVVRLSYVPYFFLCFVGLLLAMPIRPWLPELGAPGNDWRRVSLLALLVAIPLFTLHLAGARGVQFDVRYTLAALVPFYLLAGHALAIMSDPRLRYAWLSAMIAFSLLGIHTQFTVPYKENYRDALAYLHDHYRSGDCISYGLREKPPLQWHLYGYDNLDVRTLGTNELAAGGPGCRQVWLVLYERVTRNAAQGRVLERSLAEQRPIVAERPFHWVRVVQFGELNQRQ